MLWESSFTEEPKALGYEHEHLSRDWEVCPAKREHLENGMLELFRTSKPPGGIRKTRFTTENGKVWVFTWLGPQNSWRVREEVRNSYTHCPDQHFSVWFCFSFLFLLSSRLLWSLWISDLWSFPNLLCSSKAACMSGARAEGQMLAHCSHLSPASPAHLSVKETWKQAHAHTDLDHMLKSAQSSVKHCFSFVLSLLKICWRTKEHWVLYLHP